MKTRLAGLTTLALLAVFISVCAPQAYATLGTAELKVFDGNGNSVDIIDGAAGDTCGIVGTPNNCVTFNGVVGDWDINVDTGTSKSAASPNLMDVSFNAHHTAGTGPAGAGQLTIEFSDMNFAPAVLGLVDQIGGTLTSGMSLTAQLFGAHNNTLFDTSAGNKVGADLTFSSSPFSGTDGGPVAGVSPYAMTMVLKLSIAEGATGSTTGDYSTAGIPEPASVALLGGVLLLTVNAIRRKRRA